MSNHILLLNCGSSSMKYQLFDPEAATALAVGIVERIGQEQGKLKHEVGGEEFVVEKPFPNHTVAFAEVVAAFKKYGPSLDGVQAVGHRTVARRVDVPRVHAHHRRGDCEARGTVWPSASAQSPRHRRH